VHVIRRDTVEEFQKKHENQSLFLGSTIAKFCRMHVLGPIEKDSRALGGFAALLN
jgi:hypothetical protein